MGCCVDEFQAGAIGVKFVLTVTDKDDKILDIEDATVLRMTFTPPTGASFEHSAARTSHPGEMQYISTTAEFTAVGTWRFQGFAEFPDGSSSLTTIASFKVNKNLPAPP